MWYGGILMVRVQTRFRDIDIHAFPGELIASAGDGAYSSIDNPCVLFNMVYRWHDNYMGAKYKSSRGELRQ